MDVQVVIGLLLSMVTLVTRGRIERRESPRSQVLKSILRQERDYDVIAKRGEVQTIDVDLKLECCPSETQNITPVGGISREGKLLLLYRDAKTVQRFEQTTCLQYVLNEPCEMLDPLFRDNSRCVQKYSWVYAFVKDVDDKDQRFRLDYIKLRSGCKCEANITYRKRIEVP